MNIFCIGINHRTAPIEIREKLWFSDDEVRAFLPKLKEQTAAECVLTSTCNRTELYYVPNERSEDAASIRATLTEFKHATDAAKETNFYALTAMDAVKHLFSVATGIDSMVIGDVQILGQIKGSFAIAQGLETTGALMNRLFNHALHIGKRARTETEIGEGAISISYAAAELASKIFDDLSKRTAMLIGVGETGKLTAKHLAGRNLGKLLLTNRTRERAEEVSRALGGTVIDFDLLQRHLPTVDIVITAVDTTTHILSAENLRQTMRQRGNKPLFIIDIGVPRNIDPSANTIENIFLHDIDALNQVVDNNLSRRRGEIRKVESIIEAGAAEFELWFNSLKLTPTIQDLREQFEAIRRTEVEKHRHSFAANQHEDIEILTKRIINKILHTPLVNLRNGSSEESPDTRNRIHLIRHLFGLDRKKSSS